jgi:Inner membrane protein YgaP-like, transmembrane domain
MIRNEHAIDRGIRIVLGAVLLLLVFVGPKTTWGWLGLVPLATGLVGFCPLYRLLGARTCELPGGAR